MDIGGEVVVGGLLTSIVGGVQKLLLLLLLSLLTSIVGVVQKEMRKHPFMITRFADLDCWSSAKGQVHHHATRFTDLDCWSSAKDEVFVDFYFVGLLTSIVGGA